MKSNSQDDKDGGTGDEIAGRNGHFARRFGVAGNALVTVERPGKRPARMRLAEFLKHLTQKKLFE
jgi:hypothetical protein